MHVRRVASKQHTLIAIRCRLPSHVGEPADKSGTVDSVVGPINGDKAFAEIAQCGFVCSDMRLGQHHPDLSPFSVEYLPVLDLVLDLANGVSAGGSTTDARVRLLSHLDLGDQ